MTEGLQVILEGLERTLKGKGPAASLRREGFIPGILYGEGKSSLSVQVKVKELDRALRTRGKGNVLVTLRLGSGQALRVGSPADKGKDHTVLVKEMQHHPVTHQILHVDFHEISLTKRITVAVPLAFKGEPVGVKMGEGVTEHLRWELEVECLPTEIPSEIPVEISALQLNQTLHAREISLPPGVVLKTDPEQPVAACVPPKKEEIPLPAEATAAEVAEPEVIMEKKPEEEVELPPEGTKPGKEKEKEEGKKG